MIPPVKSRVRRKPRTIREIAQHKARLKQREEAKRLKVRPDEVLDAKAEAVWAKFADPLYYAKEFETSAYRRKTEGPSLNIYKRESIHCDAFGNAL